MIEIDKCDIFLSMLGALVFTGGKKYGKKANKYYSVWSVPA